MTKNLPRNHGLVLLSKEKRATDLSTKDESPFYESLARDAQQRGCITPQQVIHELVGQMKDNLDYMDYRRRAYNDQGPQTRIQRKNEALALACEMLSQAYGTLEE